ncbi:MAG: hypothetical protein D3923_11440, partial [Candidatus Electrothrix sp. AR3]|nr:hypothetical protein [Candidatus Electrothrix sp. AR3]
GKKDLFVLIPDPDGKVGEIVISTNDTEDFRLNKNRESLQTFASETFQDSRKILSTQEIKDTFAEVLEAIPAPEEKYLLYFISETADLTPESKKQLPKILNNIKKRLPCEISIIGHTDTTASAEYNLALSLKRASAIKKKLLTVGVPSEMIELSARGEADLLVPTTDNVSKLENRRIEIFVK